MKRIILLFLFPFSLLSCSKTSNLKLIYIKKVDDGDTYEDAKNIKYRLYGADTPELHNQYNNFETTNGIEYLYAYNAKLFSSNLLLNKKVKILYITDDPYDRKVVKIFVNNQDLSYLLIKNGLARVAYISLNTSSPYYTSDYSYYKKLLLAQKWAHDNKKGFWNQIDLFKDIFPKA
ncbi:MAG: thermonuclease family protein [Mycoplasmatales bacterium]|nr:thermonuclease family protein [Mycoplasmatales bacterium]